ncbi:CNTD2 protein, partial [Polypterus senegalus]
MFIALHDMQITQHGGSSSSKPTADHAKRRNAKMEKCRGADDILMETFAENTWVCRQAEILHAEDRLWYCGLSVNSSLPAMQQVMNDLEEAMQSLGLLFEREYSWDIFCSMMKRQSHYVFERAELPKGITVEMRALLVDWLIQVHVIFLAKYFLELTLLDPEYTLYEPAQLAAAALCLSRKLLNKNCCWDEEEAWARAGQLYSFSKIMLTKIQQRMLKAAAQASSLETQATFLKYSIPERLKISSHPAIFYAHPLNEYS